MTQSPVVLAIQIALVVLGVRGFWQYQHRLNVRGYMWQAGGVLAGLGLMFLGFYLPKGFVSTVFFVYGIISAPAFLLFPDIVYYSLRFHDRHKTATGHNGIEPMR